MRLIDADALKEQIENFNCKDCHHYNYVRCRACQIDDALIYIDDAPTVEQPEQKHGHWISVPDKSPKTTTINMYSFIYSCSECGKAVGHHAEYNYCPGCGAIMTWMVNQDES